MAVLSCAGYFVAARARAEPTHTPEALRTFAKTERELAPYHDAVRHYRAGSRAQGVRGAQSFAATLDRVTSNLAKLTPTFETGHEGSARDQWTLDDLKAAIVIETDQALASLDADAPNTAKLHLDAARAMLGATGTTDPAWVMFHRTWWRNVVPWITRRVPLTVATDFIDAALALYPRDPEVLLAAGSFFETALQTSTSRADASESPLVTRAAFQKERAQLGNRKEARLALRYLSRALDEAPELSEVRLRRGRVFGLIGNDAAALGDLVPLAEKAGPPRTRYLAKLFIGAVHEQASRPRLEDAQRAYESALRERPRAQTALLALANVLLTMGNADESARLSRQALGEPRERATIEVLDPWSEYGLPLVKEAWRAFRDLRRSVSPGAP